MTSAKILPAEKSLPHAFPLLDGLRGLASLCVVLYHYHGFLVGTDSWFPGGHLAVDFFFVLSGFVLAHAYQDKLSTAGDIFEFVKRRFIRFYPLFFIWLLFPVVAQEQFGLRGVDPICVLTVPINLFFIPVFPDFNLSVCGIKAHAVFPANAVAWTLAAEFFINLFYALISRKLSNKVLIFIILTTGFAFALVSLNFETVNVGWDGHSYWAGWARASFSFFAGVALYRLRDLAPKFRVSAYAVPAIILIMLAVFSIPHGFLPCELLSCFVVFPLTIWSGARINISSLGKSLCNYLGNLSYGLYIAQLPLIPLFVREIRDIIGPSMVYDKSELIVISVLCLIVVVSFLDRVYDTPLRRFLKRHILHRPIL